MKAIYFSVLFVISLVFRQNQLPCKYTQIKNELVISSMKTLVNEEFIKYDSIVLNKKRLFLYIDLKTKTDTIKLDFTTDKGNIKLWILNNGILENRKPISDIGNKYYSPYSIRLPRKEGVYLIKLKKDNVYENRRCTCALILCCYDITPNDWELVKIK